MTAIIIAAGWPSIDDLVRIEDATFPDHPLKYDRKIFEFLMSLQQATVVTAAINTIEKHPLENAIRPMQSTIGYCAAVPLELFSELEENAKILAKHPLDKTLYIASINTIPEYQRKGAGRMMFKKVLEEASNKGFTHCAGHFNQGASAHIARSSLRITTDYLITGYGTVGEIYYFMHGEIPGAKRQ